MDLRDAIDAVAERVRALLEGLAPSFDLAPALDAAEVLRDLDRRGSARFLGAYDHAELLRTWEAHGVTAALRRRLGCGVVVRLDADQGLLRVYRDDRPEGPDALVVEAKLRIAHGPTDPAAAAFGFPPVDLLAIDWLLLQSPGEGFPEGRVALPGQRWPGLGLSREVIAAILRATRRVGAAGALGTPMHYHLALMYHRLFAYVDPVAEGRFQALARALRGRRIAEASRLVEAGRVLDAAAGRPWAWEPREMVLPASAALRAYFLAPAYQEAAARALSAARFTVPDTDAVEEATAIDAAHPAATPVPGAAAAVEEVAERSEAAGGPEPGRLPFGGKPWRRISR
jgi:hypothetical protein